MCVADFHTGSGDPASWEGDGRDRQKKREMSQKGQGHVGREEDHKVKSERRIFESVSNCKISPLHTYIFSSCNFSSYIYFAFSPIIIAHKTKMSVAPMLLISSLPLFILCFYSLFLLFILCSAIAGRKKKFPHHPFSHTYSQSIITCC